MSTDPQIESVQRLAEYYGAKRSERLTALPITDPLSDGIGALARFTHYAAANASKSSTPRKPVEVEAIIDGDTLYVIVRTEEPVQVLLNPGAPETDTVARLRREAATATRWADRVANDYIDELDVDGLVHNLRLFAGALARGASELAVAQRKAAQS